MNFVSYLYELKGVKPDFPDKFGEWLGYQIRDYDREKGLVTTTLAITDAHLSPSRAVHGGVISGFLDFTCGCAVFAVIDKTMLCSTVDLDVKYFKPLKTGDEIVAKARILHKGNTLCSAMATLYLSGDDSKPLAMATGTFNLYQIKR